MGATAARDDEPEVNVAGLADEAPTQQFMGAGVGDRCAACGTPLATDQKYCLNCGERRGKPRFAVGATAAPAAAAPAPPSRPPKKQRLSSSTALVAGIGTLLLAMGVGVLIGHTNNGSSKNANAPAQIITVGGGSAATSTGAAATTSGGAKAKTAKKAKADNSKPKISKKQAAKAQAAASKVLGSSSKNLPPATTKVGDKGHGAGYSNGHFTGTFFGQ